MRKTLISFLCLIAILAVPAVVFGQGTLGDALGNLEGVADPAGIDTSRDAGSIVGQAINIALSLVGLIFLVLTVYAGLTWMTSRGNEEQISKARKTLIASVIGLIITVSAYAITVLVTSQFQ